MFACTVRVRLGSRGLSYALSRGATAELMALKDRIYWRTQAGEDALTSGESSLPSDYRRILKFVERRTHSAVIQGQLRQYPDLLLEDWLTELEEAGYLSSVRAEITQDLDFTDLLRAQRARKSSTNPEDTEHVENQLSAVAPALHNKGVFLSQDRLNNRAPSAKNPREIAILIVEDDPDQAALAELRLSSSGYKVRSVPDAKGLLEMFNAEELPDLVLLDVMLPDVTGFDILASMRRHPALASLPVILLTVLVEQDNIRRGLALGADGYVTKPYSKRILTATIREVLKHA